MGIVSDPFLWQLMESLLFDPLLFNPQLPLEFRFTDDDEEWLVKLGAWSTGRCGRLDIDRTPKSRRKPCESLRGDTGAERMRTKLISGAASAENEDLGETPGLVEADQDVTLGSPLE